MKKIDRAKTVKKEAEQKEKKRRKKKKRTKKKEAEKKEKREKRNVKKNCTLRHRWKDNAIIIGLFCDNEEVDLVVIVTRRGMGVAVESK